jgi:integrative and conjugative element protein (TIGR02256 family)
MNQIFCSDDGKICLTLTEPVIKKINHLSTIWSPLETGGILLGYFDDNFRHATVIEASRPPLDSRHGKSFFYRGTKGIKAVLDWGKSQNPRLVYVGEWHSHPGGIAIPSNTDISQLKDFARRNLYGSVTPILLIKGSRVVRKSKWSVSVMSQNMTLIKLLEI